MLTLTFLGVGSAFAKRNYQSNALVEAWKVGPHAQSAPDDTLLIDFGSTGPTALHQLKDQPGFDYLNDAGRIRYSAIRNLFITHLHGDHVGGLEELAVVTRYGSAGMRPRLHVDRSLVEPLWENCLKGGLGVHSAGIAQLRDYFDVALLDARRGQDSFRLLERYEFAPVVTDHIRIRTRHDWPSFGLLVRAAGTAEAAYFSGDTRFDAEALGVILPKVGVAFHEVQLEEHPNPVHATLAELRTLPLEHRQKMVLYHYSDAWTEPPFASVGREFRGFAQAQIRYTLLGS